MGNRIEKKYFPEASNRNHYISDFYVRDAQGNIMATYKYEFDFANSVNRFDLEEFHMYGSSRIGTIQLGFPLYENGSPNPNWTEPITNLRVGHKRYELTNHGSATLTTGLGNVMAVVNDRTQGVHADADGIIDYYEATVLKANDYYPFGSLMPGREYSAGDYRFGFNGMEKDYEIKGIGNSYTTEFRQNDPRLGRWFSIDPITQSWQSPYTSMDNNPIVFIDPFGDKIYFDSRKDYRAFKKQSKKDGTWGKIKDTYKGRNSPRNLKILETSKVNNPMATATIQEHTTTGNNSVEDFDYLYFNSHASDLNEAGVGGQNEEEFERVQPRSATEVPLEFTSPSPISGPILSVSRGPAANLKVSAPFIPGYTDFLSPDKGLSQVRNAANVYLNTTGATQIFITIGTNAVNLDQNSANPDGRSLRQLLWDRAQVIRGLLIQMGVPVVAFPNNWLQFAPGTSIETTIRVR